MIKLRRVEGKQQVCYVNSQLLNEKLIRPLCDMYPLFSETTYARTVGYRSRLIFPKFVKAGR